MQRITLFKRGKLILITFPSPRFGMAPNISTLFKILTPKISMHNGDPIHDSCRAEEGERERRKGRKRKESTFIFFFGRPHLGECFISQQFPDRCIARPPGIAAKTFLAPKT